MQIIVLRIAKDAKKDKDCKIKAHEAIPFLVLTAKMKKGPVKIPIQYTTKKST